MVINFKNDKITQIYYDDEGNLQVQSQSLAGVTSTQLNEQSVKQKQTLISIADEQITLFDGKKLKRIRDNLIVE